MTSSSQHLTNIGTGWNLKSPAQQAQLVTMIKARIAARRFSGGVCGGTGPGSLAEMVGLRDAALAARNASQAAAAASAALIVTRTATLDAQIVELDRINDLIALGGGGGGKVPAALLDERAAVVSVRAYYGI